MALRVREFPLVCAAFADGELSYSKVRALTRVAGVEREGELLELARHATASQLERVYCARIGGWWRPSARRPAAAVSGGW